MSRVLRYVVFVAFLAIIIALARPSLAAIPDCGENTGQKATGSPIPIGVVVSITGLGTVKESSDATKAYFDCVNANGGIHGRPIVYLVEDDQGKVDIGVQVAKKLVRDENVYAIIGGLSATDCVANGQYYAAQNILDVGQGIALQCFQSKNIAEINAGARQGGIATADYARRKLGANSVACWIPKYPGGTTSAAALSNGDKNMASR
jgi:branched-chain amino acid transport system substrate-binding protein